LVFLMRFGECKRDKVELRKRGAIVAKSMHSKASFGTQIEERKYNNEWRLYCTNSKQIVHLWLGT